MTAYLKKKMSYKRLHMPVNVRRLKNMSYKRLHMPVNVRRQLSKAPIYYAHIKKECMGIYTQHACVAFEIGKRMEN